VAFAVFWGLDLGTEAGSLLPRQTNKQASYKKKKMMSVTGSKLMFLMCSDAGKGSVLLLDLCTAFDP